MIKSDHLREFIIKPALEKIQIYSPNDVELLMFTCATESRGGYFLKQEGGPALGIYQMEPLTYNDIWVNFINLKQSLLTMMINNFGCGRTPSEDRLVYDLEFATVMCRIHYMRNHEVIPDHQEADLIWSYYKRYYNTALGAAKKDESINAYHQFIGKP